VYGIRNVYSKYRLGILKRGKEHKENVLFDTFLSRFKIEFIKRENLKVNIEDHLGT